jgi:hypothetical protein
MPPPREEPGEVSVGDDYAMISTWCFTTILGDGGKEKSAAVAEAAAAYQRLMDDEPLTAGIDAQAASDIMQKSIAKRPTTALVTVPAVADVGSGLVTNVSITLEIDPAFYTHHPRCQCSACVPTPAQARTMPARALNRGPQKIGLFTL